MKKIIIMFMAISMLLVSCSTPNTPSYDDVIPTSTDSGSDNESNGGSDNESNPSTPSNPINQITQYTVTFNSNGGSSVDSQTVAPNGHATRPTNPTKADCEFAYWYSTNESVEYNFDTATITDNITLYAKWYMHYFEHEDGETVNNFTYKVKYTTENTTYETNEPLQINTVHNGFIINGMTYKCNYSTNVNNNKVIFEYNKYNNTIPNLKVHNVTVDRNVMLVTIELVDNN